MNLFFNKIKYIRINKSDSSAKIKFSGSSYMFFDYRYFVISVHYNKLIVTRKELKKIRIYKRAYI